MLATSAAFLIVDDGAFAIVHLTPVENLLCPISHTSFHALQRFAFDLCSCSFWLGF